MTGVEPATLSSHRQSVCCAPCAHPSVPIATRLEPVSGHPMPIARRGMERRRRGGMGITGLIIDWASPPGASRAPANFPASLLDERERDGRNRDQGRHYYEEDTLPIVVPPHLLHCLPLSPKAKKPSGQAIRKAMARPFWPRLCSGAAMNAPLESSCPSIDALSPPALARSEWHTGCSQLGASFQNLYPIRLTNIVRTVELSRGTEVFFQEQRRVPASEHE